MLALIVFAAVQFSARPAIAQCWHGHRGGYWRPHVAVRVCAPVPFIPAPVVVAPYYGPRYYAPGYYHRPYYGYRHYRRHYYR